MCESNSQLRGLISIRKGRINTASEDKQTETFAHTRAVPTLRPSILLPLHVFFLSFPPRKGPWLQLIFGLPLSLLLSAQKLEQTFCCIFGIMYFWYIVIFCIFLCLVHFWRISTYFYVIILHIKRILFYMQKNSTMLYYVHMCAYAYLFPCL